MPEAGLPSEDMPTISSPPQALAAEEEPTGKHHAVPSLDTPPPRPTHPVLAIPGYEIMGEIGRGGMGVVYKAHQNLKKRFVAIKMISTDARSDSRRLQRFRAEMHTLAQLSHPNIIQLYEAGEDEGLPYFSLEYCSGGSLAKKMPTPPCLPK